MIGRQVFYEGRVQGVGFRYTVRSVARGFEVRGWVKNLADGRVELQVCGESDEVREFLKAVRDSELNSCIKSEQVLEIPPMLDVKSFQIRF